MSTGYRRPAPPVTSLRVGGPDVGRLDVRVEVEFRSGRYVCASLKVTSADEGDDGVTAEALRELPVGRIVTEVARDREVEGQLRARGRKVIAAGRSDDLTLEAVAACYRYGYAVGGSPTKEVMDLLGVPRSKAGRWVAMARQEGYLGETSPRVAGGVADDCRRCRGSGAIGVAPGATQPGWRDPQCADWETCPSCGGTG